MENPPTDLAWEDEILDRTYAYWRGKRQGDRLPSRGDLDPAEIPRLLPNLFLIDVLRDPLRFRYRLIGTAITERFQRDSTGRLIDESLYGPYAKAMQGLFARVVEMRQPLITFSTWR